MIADKMIELTVIIICALLSAISLRRWLLAEVILNIVSIPLSGRFGFSSFFFFDPESPVFVERVTLLARISGIAKTFSFVSGAFVFPGCAWSVLFFPSFSAALFFSFYRVSFFL
jgi:hypothetical protein